MKKRNRKIWHNPWGYRESIVAVAALCSVGFVLQLAFGSVDFASLRWPVNGFIGAIIVMFIAALSVYRSSRFFRWISGIPLSVTLIATMTLLGIVMGLVPQSRSGEQLGLTAVTTFRPFVLVYSMTLVTLGCVIVRRTSRFRTADYAFYLNHIGLWLFLFSAGIGAADVEKHTITVREGETVSSVVGDHGHIYELPLAVRLNDFDIEEYPSRIAVLDRSTGDILPAGRPDWFQLGEAQEAILTGRWMVDVEEYLQEAVRFMGGDYMEARMPASMPAARVKVRDTTSGLASSGWVSSGNAAQPAAVLNLGPGHILVMSRPEPKRYISDINVFTPDGRTVHALLEVNKPLRIGNWTIYQSGYDRDAGRLSEWSALELVYDPWLKFVYTGIALLGAGSLCMVWSGSKRKKSRR